MPEYDLYVVYSPVTVTSAQARELRRRTDAKGKVLVAVGVVAAASRDFKDAEEAIAAMKPARGDLVRFEREGELTPESLNEWARRAGMTPFAEPGNATYVGNGVAVVHRLKGPARVDFGRPVVLVDPMDGSRSGPVRLWEPQIAVGESAAVGYLVLDGKKEKE